MFETLSRPRFVLVYQVGIANIFRVSSFNMANYGRNAFRVYQGDFKTAEAMLRGMELSGAIVKAAVCNSCGDIIDSEWSQDFNSAPFSDSFKIREYWKR